MLEQMKGQPTSIDPAVQNNSTAFDLYGRKKPSEAGMLFSGIIASLLFFCLTSPQTVPSILLIAGFIMLMVFIFCTLRLVLLGTGVHIRLSASKSRAFLITGTILPAILLMMQSIGQLTIRDVLTLSGLFLIGIFYISRARRI